MHLIAVFLALACLAPARVYAATTSPPPPTTAACLQRFHRPCLAPAQIYAAYGTDALLRHGTRGQGRTIAIVVSFGSPTLRADLSVFDRAFNLPDPQLSILSPLGPMPAGGGGWAGETTLDVEWAHAIAPDARLVVLVSPVSETEGLQGMPEFLKIERYILQHHLADVISQSWGATEDTLFDAPGRAIIAQFHTLYADAAAQGVTVVAASGDEGAAGIDLSLKHLYPNPAVGYPASDPLVLAVGGTQLALTSTGQVRNETAWAGSGGGISKLFAEPSYQAGLPPPVQRLLAHHRGLPDIAYDAAGRSPILTFQGGKWHLVAGTSAAAPQWAGLVALADSAAGHDLGLINPLLYRLALTPRAAADLRDITAGNSVGPIHGGANVGGVGFSASRGWDAVTGLGSPRAASLIPDLVRLAATPSQSAHW